MFEGTKIRLLRKEKKLSLKELADKSGVSVATISQIERGNADPTMTTFYKICRALNVTIASMMADDSVQDRVVRKDNRKTMFLPNSKIKYQSLTSGLKDNLEMLLIEIGPKQKDRQGITHIGEECGYVVKGQLVVILGEKEYVLEEGDSIYFNSMIPHRFINRQDETSISIWAMTPPTF